jgi:hypothetical protein
MADDSKSEIVETPLESHIRPVQQHYGHLSGSIPSVKIGGSNMLKRCFIDCGKMPNIVESFERVDIYVRPILK